MIEGWRSGKWRWKREIMLKAISLHSFILVAAEKLYNKTPTYAILYNKEFLIYFARRGLLGSGCRWGGCSIQNSSYRHSVHLVRKIWKWNAVSLGILSWFLALKILPILISWSVSCRILYSRWVYSSLAGFLLLKFWLNFMKRLSSLVALLFARVIIF